MTEETNEKKMKVMLLDDDTFLLEMYKTKFETKGYEVVTTTSSEECLQMLRDGEKPNILMLDMIMPDIDGPALLKIIHEEKIAEEALIIVLSNQSQQSDIDEAMKYNIDGYIIKADTTPSGVVGRVQEIYSSKK